MKQTSFTIRKRENGKYQAIIRQKENDKWRQVESKGGFDKKIQATQWANGKVSEWQQKIFNDYEQMTVGQLKIIYLDQLKEKTRFQTYKTAKSSLRKNTLDYKVITEITPYEYREFKNSSTHGTLKRMRAFYNFIIKELKIKIDNPFENIPHKQERKKRNIESYEFEEILKHIKDDQLKLICKIAYNSGLRVSEILGLQITDIENSAITVTKQFSVSERKFTTPKSKNGIRTVPIKKDLEKEIYQYFKNKNCITIDGRIFSKPYITLFLKLRNSLINTPYKDITFHYFRHSYLTRLVQNGLDLNTVAYLAGDTLDTIVKTYIHLTKDTFDIAKEFIEKTM